MTTESWGSEEYGYAPWGGGTTIVTLDSLSYCPCVYVTPTFLTPDYCNPSIASAEARVTTQGRANLARAISDGLAFQVKEFSIGRGGFDIENPIAITEVEDDRVILIDEIYRATIDDVEWANSKSATFLMRLNDVGSLEVCSVVGEIGLWAQIAYSYLNPHEVGDWFLFAVAHFPMLCLVGQSRSFRLTAQF